MESKVVFALEFKAIGINKLNYNFDLILCEIKNAITSFDEEKVNDALKALLSLIENKEINDICKNSLFDILYQKFAWKQKVAYNQTIKTIIKILIEESDLIPNDYLFSCNHVLEKLYDEFTLTQNLDNDDFNEKLEIRKNLSELTSMLFTYYNNNKKSLPEIIIKWGRSCVDKNEFAEIRKYWLPYKDELF